jgi:hypothetical protein
MNNFRARPHPLTSIQPEPFLHNWQLIPKFSAWRFDKMEQTHRKQNKTRNQGDLPLEKTPEYPVVGAPVDSKKKKKSGSSRATRRLEDIESRVSESVHRVTKAVNKGVATYIDERDKSARKRRDGTLVDFYQNAAQGVSEALADSSPVLTDIAKALNTRRLRKRIRRYVRVIPVLW